MKKIILLLVLALTFTFGANSQTIIDLSNMTGNTNLGQNCSPHGSIQHFVTNGDVNTNGHRIKLKNAVLTINGNLYGGGEIVTCGSSESSFCVQGTITNIEYDYNDMQCSTLSNTTFTKDDFKWSLSNNILKAEVDNISIYDMTGKMIISTSENNVDVSFIEKGIYIIRLTKDGKVDVVKTNI